MVSLSGLLRCHVTYSAYLCGHSSALFFTPIVTTPTGTLGSTQGYSGVGRMPTMVRDVGSSDQRGQKDNDMRSPWWSPMIGSHNQIGSSSGGNRGDCMYDEYNCMRSPHFHVHIF